jgi:PAS domain S-box-containing protein
VCWRPEPGPSSLAEQGSSHHRLAAGASPGVAKDEGTQMTSKMLNPVQELTAARAEIRDLQLQVHTYQQILDHIPAMILYKGPHAGIRYANQAFRRYYGVADQLPGNMLGGLLSEIDDLQQALSDDDQVLASGALLVIDQEPRIRWDGAVRTFHTIKHPVYDQQGAIIGTLGISDDITGR